MTITITEQTFNAIRENRPYMSEKAQRQADDLLELAGRGEPHPITNVEVFRDTDIDVTFMHHGHHLLESLRSMSQDPVLAYSKATRGGLMADHYKQYPEQLPKAMEEATLDIREAYSQLAEVDKKYMQTQT